MGRGVANAHDPVLGVPTRDYMRCVAPRGPSGSARGRSRSRCVSPGLLHPDECQSTLDDLLCEGDFRTLGAFSFGRTTCPSCTLIYMSAPLFDSQQDALNDEFAEYLEADPRLQCVLPKRNLGEGAQYGAQASLTEPETFFEEFARRWSCCAYPEEWLLKVTKKDSSGVWTAMPLWLPLLAAVAARIDYYAMTVLCNAAICNYTFLGVGTITESAYMAGVSMPLVLFAMPQFPLVTLPGPACPPKAYSFRDPVLLEGCPAQLCAVCASYTSMPNALTGSEEVSLGMARTFEDAKDALQKQLASETGKQQLLAHHDSAFRVPVNMVRSVLSGALLCRKMVEVGCVLAGPVRQAPLPEQVCRAVDIIHLVFRLQNAGLLVIPHGAPACPPL